MISVAGLIPLAAASAAWAAEGHAAGHGGGIPWGEIVKQAINLGVLAGVLFYFLRKPLGKYLKERSETLKKAIDDAASARAEAGEKLAAVEARVARLAEEIGELNRRTDAEADVESRRIRDAAQVEIERIRQQGRFTADQEVKKAREELRREAADLSARAAGEIVAGTLTPADQERLVRESLEKIREIV